MPSPKPPIACTVSPGGLQSRLDAIGRFAGEAAGHLFQHVVGSGDTAAPPHPDGGEDSAR